MEVKVVDIKSIRVEHIPRTGKLATRMREYEAAYSKMKENKAILFPLDGANPRSIMLRASRAAKRLGISELTEIGRCSYDGKDYIYAKMLNNVATNDDVVWEQ